MRNRIAVCGHFGIGHTLLNGQTVKTVIVTDELKRELGKETIWKIDTHGRLNQICMFPKLVWALMTCTSIIILPAHDALIYEVPWLKFWNMFFKKKLFYVVIGGWLKNYLKNYPKITDALKTYNGIYVETSKMKRDLESVGFCNVDILPNCKPISILKEEELILNFKEPLCLVTFSRVMKEKGIEDAINAVSIANNKIGHRVYHLVIYGQIDDNQQGWFEGLLKNRDSDSSWEYGGLVPFAKSTDVLKKYFALLFPTYYDGEGFAGTLIDAFASGVPVIASDWKYNSEIVKDGYTGKIVKTHDIMELSKSLISIYKAQQSWIDMKHNCIKEAQKYTPQDAMRTFVNELKNY